MYLFDPHSGKLRRSQLQAQAASAAKRTGRELAGKAEGLLHRAKGVVAKAGASIACSGSVDDDVLAERVRSRLGHITQHAHEIETAVSDGIVSLHGILPADEHERLNEEVRRIPGVKAVQNRLACETPA